MKPRRHNSGVHLHPKSKVWCFTYKGPDGRYIHRLTECTEKKAAKDARIQFLELLRQGGAPGEMARWTINRAADHWLELAKSTTQAKKTMVKHLYVMGALKKRMGGKKLCDITSWVIEQHQAKRSAEMGPNQVNREIRYLALLLKKAKLWNRLRDDYKPLRAHQSVVGKALTAEEARFLIQAAAGNENWHIVGWCAALALNTGLRGGELKGIQLGKIEQDPPAVWVGRATTKTDAGARRIPLNKAAQDALGRIVYRAKSLGCLKPDHYVLPACLGRHTKENDPLHGKRGYDPTRPQESLRTAWESLCAEAGKKWTENKEHKHDPFTNLRFHDLRHTFITQCGMAGVPIEHTMAMVGQMSPTMTRFYTHLFDSATRSVVDKVQDVLGITVPTALLSGGETNGRTGVSSQQ